LRVLVVGAGAAAQALHLPVLARLRDEQRLELCVVCDLDAQRAAAAQRRYRFAEFSTDACSSIERPDLDAVYVYGSAALHQRCGLKALQSGKHLFVEKPVAPSYAAAMLLADAARVSGTVAVGALNRRFYEALRQVRSHAGRSGWRFAEAVFHRAEFARPVPYGSSSWLGANGIHALDALLFMMGGPPAWLSALSDQSSTSNPSAFSALMRWHDGAQGVLLCNNSAGARREEYVFHGLAETFRVSEGLVTRENEAGSRTTRHAWIGDGIAAEHQAFLDAIDAELEPIHSLSAIAPSLYVAELIERGHSGAVQLPIRTPQHALQSPDPGRRASRPAAGIVLTADPDLLAAVERRLPSVGTISLDEIRTSDRQAPHVTAVILGRGALLKGDDLEKMPNLAVVGIHGLSVNHCHPELLLARGIAIVNAEAAYADEVAEFALGLMILGRRRAFAAHDAMRAGGWLARAHAPGIKAAIRRRALLMRPLIRRLGLEPLAARFWRSTASKAELIAARSLPRRDLRGATVGLIGWGANAHALTRRLLAAGAAVLVYTEHAAAADIEAAGARAASLLESLAADVVSLHRGLTPATRHCLKHAELDKLRPGALLINVARGALIEPQALLWRLRRGDIFACLDTYEDEPLAPADPLRRLPNVFLTSHIAGGSEEMRKLAAREVVGKVAGYLEGEREGVLSAARLSTMT
jgi:phosphoglycerate dehydrogenase-like enzyme/predicted dehydrogenase